jgi:hypothetical protein
MTQARTGLYSIRRSAQILRRDIDAVRNALTERWSNGQAEGQINRLKTLKRASYGRAGTELLRARTLPLRLWAARKSRQTPFRAARHRTTPSSVFPATARNAGADSSVRVISIGWPIGELLCMLWRLHRIDNQPIWEVSRDAAVSSRVRGYAGGYNFDKSPTNP